MRRVTYERFLQVQSQVQCDVNKDFKSSDSRHKQFQNLLGSGQHGFLNGKRGGHPESFVYSCLFFPVIRPEQWYFQQSNSSMVLSITGYATLNMSMIIIMMMMMKYAAFNINPTQNINFSSHMSSYTQQNISFGGHWRVRPLTGDGTQAYPWPSLRPPLDFQHCWTGDSAVLASRGNSMKLYSVGTVSSKDYRISCYP